MRSRTRPLQRLVGVVAVALALAGCGSDRAPAESVPGLARQLETVDTALAAGDYDRARRALGTIVRTTTRSREAGTLAPTEADQVLAAVARLVTALPDSSATPTPAPSSPAAPKSDDDMDDDKDKDEKDKDDGDKDDGDKDDGDGSKTGNGPDNGHGD